MFGGAGGRGARASVASLEGLRNVMRNDTETDSAPKTSVAPAKPAAPAIPAAPADDKQTLRGLNDRLFGYLGRVKQLEGENKKLQDQIDEILAKRKTPGARDWDEVEKPLEELKKKVSHLIYSLSSFFFTSIHLFCLSILSSSDTELVCIHQIVSFVLVF